MTTSEIGESRCLLETTLMVELSDCSTKGDRRGAHPARAFPFHRGADAAQTPPRLAAPLLFFRPRNYAMPEVLAIR